MDIEGLGSRICTILCRENFVTSLVDIYALKDKKNQLLDLEGFGELSVENLLESIENSKNKSFSNLLTSFGIEGVGVEIAELITEKIPNLTQIKEKSKNKNEFNKFLEDIDGIGPIVAKKIVTWFEENKNIELVDKFSELKIGTTSEDENITTNSLEGKIFVITGSFGEYNRNEIESIIKNNGGKVSSKVSSKTDNLILGSNPGSKLEDAQKNNLEIINISELLKLISD